MTQNTKSQKIAIGNKMQESEQKIVNTILTYNLNLSEINVKIRYLLIKIWQEKKVNVTDRQCPQGDNEVC